MKGIVHIICNGQQEFWLDAENIEKVEKTFFDYRYNGSVAIVSYKDGHHDEYKGVIMVLIEHERDFIPKQKNIKQAQEKQILLPHLKDGLSRWH